ARLLAGALPPTAFFAFAAFASSAKLVIAGGFDGRAGGGGAGCAIGADAGAGGGAAGGGAPADGDAGAFATSRDGAASALPARSALDRGTYGFEAGAPSSRSLGCGSGLRSTMPDILRSEESAGRAGSARWTLSAASFAGGFATGGSAN